MEAARQFDYYHGCLRLLRLSPKVSEEHIVSLTEEGLRVSKLTSKEQAFEIAKILFSDKLFHLALHEEAESVTDEMFMSWGIG